MKATFFLFFFFYKNVLEGNNFTQKIDLTVLIPALCDCIDRGVRVLGTIKIKKIDTKNKLLSELLDYVVLFSFNAVFIKSNGG